MSKTKNELTGFSACVIAVRDLLCVSKDNKLLLYYYASNVNCNACTFFKSFTDIAAGTGLSISAIQRTNDKWREWGLLSWVQGDPLRGTANTYTLHLDKLQELVKAKAHSMSKAQFKLRQRNKERVAKYRDKHKAALQSGITEAPLQSGITDATPAELSQ